MHFRILRGRFILLRRPPLTKQKSFGRFLVKATSADPMQTFCELDFEVHLELFLTLMSHSASVPGWTGFTALGCFIAIAVLSMPWIRKTHYELFQLTHLLMYRERLPSIDPHRRSLNRLYCCSHVCYACDAWYC